MKSNLTKTDVKSAVREVMEEISVVYAHGAGKFIDSVMKSLADVADAYDEFYTRNLVEDRPELAKIFLDLRLRSLKSVEKLVQAKLKEIEAVRSRIEKTGSHKRS